MRGLNLEPDRLAQALRFPNQNFASAVVLYLGICLATGTVCYVESNDPGVLVWMFITVVVWISSTILYLVKRESLAHQTKRISQLVILVVFTNSLVFSALILYLVPQASLVLAVFMLCVVVVVSICMAAFAAPFMLLIACMAYPLLASLIIAFLLRDDLISQWLGFSVILILVGISWFTIMLSNSIFNMIDINSENEALAQKLRSALIQTDDANRAKSVFLASASHDLRQPLHALGLLVETMGGTKMTTHQTEIQSHMEAAIDSTQTMLDSLLNISKLDAGAISSEPKPFLVQSLFSKLELELAPTADEHNLIYRTRETISAAYSDPLIVELILRNLIANAIRYTQSGGLLIACRPKSGKLSIEVWDTGIGIAEEKIDDMFREFKQLDNPERDSRKGFGLGLSIAQGLAKTIDSKIEVGSKKGVGSVFRFQLERSHKKIIDDIPNEHVAFSFADTNIVIIDDDEHVREAMHQVLKNWGCRCFSGESAEEIIQSINKSDLAGDQIDLALVDYRLRHGKTGKEAIEILRASIAPKLPAIIITGDTAANRIAEARAVDALLIHKPASTKQLRKMMQKLLTDKIESSS